MQIQEHAEEGAIPKIAINIINEIKVGDGVNMESFLRLAYEGKMNTPLKELAVDKLTWGTDPVVLTAIKENLSRDRAAWVEDMWADVALTFSNHYWDHIPEKYVGEWGILENHFVERNEHQSRR